MPRSSHTETLEAFVILSEAKDLSRTIHRRNETVEILQRTLSVRFRMTRADAWWICIKGGLGGGAMGVKPELAFDVCWEIYRGAREVLETKRGVSALNWKDTGKFLWRPDFR